MKYEINGCIFAPSSQDWFLILWIFAIPNEVAASMTLREGNYVSQKLQLYSVKSSILNAHFLKLDKELKCVWQIALTVLMINFLKFYYEMAIYQNQRNQITWRPSHLQRLVWGWVCTLKQLTFVFATRL
jgi:hypothetical protein